MRDHPMPAQHSGERLGGFVRRGLRGNAAQTQAGGIVAQQVDVHAARAEQHGEQTGVFR